MRGLRMVMGLGRTGGSAPDPYGPELVTNGTFDTDVAGWDYDTGTLSWEAGQLRLDGAAPSYTAQAISGLDPAKSYRITFTMTPSYQDTARLLLITDTAGTEIFVANNTPGVPTVVTITRTGTANVSLSPQAASGGGWAPAGQKALFDNISVRQVL